MTQSIDRLYQRLERAEKELADLRLWKAQIAAGKYVRPSSIIGGVVPDTSGGSGISGSPLGVTMWKNGSGGTRSQGEVVIASVAADQTFLRTTTAADPRVIGVLDDDAVADGVAGRVRHIGYQSPVQVTGSVAAGDYLTTSTTAGKAVSAGSSPVEGAFAIALTADSGGIVSAFVFPVLSATLAGSVPTWIENTFFEEAYPGSPTAYDDEFDDTSGNSGSVNGLNARWAWRNQGGATVSYGNAGYITLNCPAQSSDNIRIIEQTLPAGDWTFEAKLSLESVASGVAVGGLALIDGTNGDLYVLYSGWASNTELARGGIQKFTNITTFNATVRNSSAAGQNPIYIRVKYISGSTSYELWLSGDGIGWTRYQTWSDTVAPTKIGLFVNETNNTGLTKLHCDYFRKVA